MEQPLETTAATIQIYLHPVQSAFTKSNAIYRGYAGGRGAGKSFVGSYDLLKRTKPGRLYGVYAPTYPMLRDATTRSLTENAKRLMLYGDFNKSSFTYKLRNDAEIICRSLDDPESARGPNLSGAWVDEMSVLKNRDGFDIVIACLREGGQQGWLSATFTPKGKMHFTYELFGKPSDEIACFHSKTSDNPFLPEAFATMLRGQYTSKRAEQELDAGFIDAGGQLFKREWFKVVSDYPKDARFVRRWDLAATVPKTGTDPDWTAGALLAHKGGQYWIVDIRHGQWSPQNVRQTVQVTASQDGKSVGIRIEQEPGSAGKLLMDEYARNVLTGYNFKGIPSTGSKETRADPLAAAAENGNVFLVAGTWNKAFLDEAETFPSGKHDDQVDAVAGAFNDLAKPMPTLIIV